MANFEVVIENSAKLDLKKIGKANLKSQFLKVVEQLKDDPFKINQRFEKLKPPVEGKYSRRINGQHRVVYKVNQANKQVVILSDYGHYE
ncbi:Txe/YoeB family addiction module toxin [Weissella oryzae SG25]|uniref:Endoribonuclease YoeB n=1 Tax=Weissella oryzae (strain DSM 25784 / JCM 18191 / LMG 30913 / SG25) TaxID=1329250 RepID=A0A069CT49_WEIOS|nr:Txe/YoeB family addiction module toxin [Weissella oryzae]GAK30582.1 Txe/YoeB family addiction module toxin [Weissella oryzae SG25]